MIRLHPECFDRVPLSRAWVKPREELLFLLLVAHDNAGMCQLLLSNSDAISVCFKTSFHVTLRRLFFKCHKRNLKACSSDLFRGLFNAAAGVLNRSHRQSELVLRLRRNGYGSGCYGGIPHITQGWICDLSTDATREFAAQ